MTEIRRKLLTICDSLDYYQSELTSLACCLEDIDHSCQGDRLRGIVGDLENLTFALRHQKHKRRTPADV